ncbi:hypothetical protein R6G99_06665, partial [Actinotignum timonense]|nr:hypothetical protein [Actinotignum timonense]
TRDGVLVIHEFIHALFLPIPRGEGSPEEVVAARNLEIVSDSGALEKAVDEALAANPDVVEKIRGGKVQAAGAIIGAVMKATHGKADAGAVRALIMERAAAE